MITYILHNIFDIFNTPTNVILLLLVFIITYGLFSLRKPSGFPPGPIGYPFIGSILDLVNDPHLTLVNYGKEYGDVFTMKIGSQPVIVLNSLDVIKEALVKKQNDFAGRPYFYSLSSLMAEESQNILFGNFTAKWKLQRKIGHQAIRNYASGEKLESLIRREAFPTFQRAVAQNNGKPFLPKPLLFLLVGNIIASMCFGKRYEYDDPELLKIMGVMNDVNESFGNGLAADFVPIFRYISTPGHIEVKTLLKEWLTIIQRQIDEHKAKLGKGDKDVESLIDDILSIQREAELAGGDRTIQLTDVNLRQTVSDIFAAGLDTTINALNWAVAYLTYYPDVQSKVQREIDDVIGDDRLPLLSDKGKLPYCEAVIHELLRIRTVVPFAIPHTTTVDTSVGGYAIPKDTWIWCNLWNVHMNEKHWDKPEEFRPERFLDSDRAMLPKLDGYMPFSGGRRVCMGEALAKNELFLLFISIFQQYTFKVPAGGKKPCLEPHCVAQIIRCCPYEVIAIGRSK
ncbi:cytochrome P450 1A5-like [Saccoglossus kowalevskii]